MLRCFLKYICPIFKCDLTSTLWSLLEIRMLIMSAGVWLTGKIGLGWVSEELDVELDPDMDTQISFVCKLLCYIVQHGPYVWWVQNANIYCVYISIHPFRKQLFKNCLLIEVSFLSGCEFCLPVCET